MSLLSSTRRRAHGLQCVVDAVSSSVPENILVVEDDHVARDALVMLLEYEGYEVRSAGGGEEAIEVIEGWTPDLVVSDVNMPRGDGLALVPALRRRQDCEDTAILLVSAINDIHRKISGLDLGADDFISKPVNPEELLARIRAHLRSTARRKELKKTSEIEVGTGLLNRRGIIDVLEGELERAKRGAVFSLLLVDLDNFKAINDKHGHHVGDLVLRHVARSIESAGRAVDRSGRWGGDEFVIMLSDCPDYDVQAALGRFRQRIEQQIAIENGDEISIRCSIGGAVYREGATIDGMLEEADSAMYRDKAKRRASVPSQ